MSQTVFSSSIQETFAELSGDWNPLHLDPIIARRTQFGRPLVHGIHLLLWALDQALEGSNPGSIAKLSCVFRGHVGVGESVRCEWTRPQDDQFHIRIIGSGGDCVSIKLSLGTSLGSEDVIDAVPRRSACVSPDIGALATLCGSTPLEIDRARAACLFPHLMSMLPRDQIAHILATTRVVGMECPGLPSIYSELTFTARASEAASPSQIAWQVKQFDPRFNRLTIETKSATAQATIEAFLRPSTQQQPTTATIRKQVANDRFSAVRAIVIGGSRGLGELCTKILAVGGADVRFSYHRGIEDAATIERDITADGGKARAFTYDALNAPNDFATQFGADWAPTHIYYFATPPILSSTKFSTSIFLQFCLYYIEGFYALWSALRMSYRTPLEFFYPSTVYVEQTPPNFIEYAAAKAAGENLCKSIEAIDKKTKIHIGRLPKLPTDQTLSLYNAEAEADPVATMLSFLSKRPPENLSQG